MWRLNPFPRRLCRPPSRARKSGDSECRATCHEDGIRGAETLPRGTCTCPRLSGLRLSCLIPLRASRGGMDSSTSVTVPMRGRARCECRVVLHCRLFLSLLFETSSLHVDCRACCACGCSFGLQFEWTFRPLSCPSVQFLPFASHTLSTVHIHVSVHTPTDLCPARSLPDSTLQMDLLRHGHKGRRGTRMVHPSPTSRSPPGTVTRLETDSLWLSYQQASASRTNTPMSFISCVSRIFASTRCKWRHTCVSHAA